MEQQTISIAKVRRRAVVAVGLFRGWEVVLEAFGCSGKLAASRVKHSTNAQSH
jgi:hypothetical protein